MTAKVKIVCARCGSDDVRRDAYAVWSVEAQEWELSAVFDAAVCESEACGGEVISLDEVPAVVPAPAVDPVDDAIAILAATHDGNDLADADLRIDERMVNASARPLPADANAAAADLKARVAARQPEVPA